MENNIRFDQFFVVPLIGGILCLIQFFASDIIFLLDFNIILFFGEVFLTINNIVFGIIMIVSAVRLKAQSRTLVSETTKLMVLSWISIGGPIAFGIFYLFFGFIFTGSFTRLFFIPNIYGVAGGLVVILGIFLLKMINERNVISSSRMDKETSETQSIEPEAQSVEPEAQSVEPEAQSIEPEAQSIEPEAQSVEPEAQSVEPETQSVEPETQSVEPETQSVEPETPTKLNPEVSYKFCPRCGNNLEGKKYSYCPNCGNKIH